MGTIKLGCSGWDYRDWQDVFYRNKDESKLQAYSRIFNIAEVNSTFYVFPSEGIVFGWSKYSPPDFKFTVKLNRLITHEKTLDLSKGVSDDLRRFCELLAPMRVSGKLACILIQLPPSMKFRKEKIEAFLEILPSDIRFALEYRDTTWLTEASHKLLSDHNVACVAVDEPLLPPDLRLTSDFAYVRWHGRGHKMWYNYRYGKDELASWTAKIKEISGSADVLGFFNNHYHGYAPENCLEVLEMLGISTPVQKEAREHILSYRKEKPGTKMITKTLTDFSNEKENVFTVLSGFIEPSRIEKAKEIKDIEIIEKSESRIAADVRGYSIYIDLEKKFILHDCPDWKITMREKKFCKHIGALFLALPEDEAHVALTMMKLQKWEYSQ